MAKNAKKSGLGILIALVGAYLLFKPKTAAAATPAPTWAPPDFTPTASTSARYDTSVTVPYRPAW